MKHLNIACSQVHLQKVIHRGAVRYALALQGETMEDVLHYDGRRVKVELRAIRGYP